MMTALKDTITELLGSKKFLVLLATVGAALAARLGWNVSADAILPYLGLAASAIVAQGIADHGKGAAEVQAAASTKVIGSASALLQPEQPKGFARLAVMAVIAGMSISFALVDLGACATTKADLKSMSGSFAGCEKTDLGAIVAEDGLTLLGKVAADIYGNSPSLESDFTGIGVRAGKGAVKCAIVAVTDVIHGAAGSGALTSRPLPGLVRAQTWAAQP